MELRARRCQWGMAPRRGPRGAAYHNRGKAGDALELEDDDGDVSEDVVECGGALVDHPKLDLAAEVQGGLK